MPNTPALIGQGISGLFARAAVSADDRAQIEAVLAATGQLMWFDREDALDAVTALSGSGPAYVFYVIEAMMAAAEQMGLSSTEGRRLALATLAGATALAQASDDPPSLLRERVTSKGGTTAAALDVLEAAGVKAAFIAAIKAAETRAGELGDSFAG
jgi:pyrroline-5-carboxylate reductase